MTDEREITIYNEAKLLAWRLAQQHGMASIHLARLIRADHDTGALWWYASRLAGALGIEAGETYQAMQQAARSLVKAGDVGIEDGDE